MAGGSAGELHCSNTAKRPSEAFIQPTASMGPISRPLVQLSYQQQQQQLQMQQHRLRQRQQQREQEQQPSQQTQHRLGDSSQQVQPAQEAIPVGGGGGCQQLAAVQNKRKEKARIAARARRSQEAGIILEMAAELCISQDKLRRIDKATIVKLAIDYIRAHRVLCNNSVSISGGVSSNASSSAIIDNGATSNINNENDHDDRQLEDEKRCEPPLHSAPKLATASIFAPKTADNMNPHFLMIEEKTDGKGTFVLKPDTEILDEDDLTHLAPQAGDVSISLEVEPLEGISLADLLIPSPNLVNHNLYQYNSHHHHQHQQQQQLQQQQISAQTKRMADWRKTKSFYETPAYSDDWRYLSS